MGERARDIVQEQQRATLDATEPPVAPRWPHRDHVTVEAWLGDCIEGECDHVDPDTADSTDRALDTCPSIQFVVCIDCMDEQGTGRDERYWDDMPLCPWPCPVRMNGGEHA